MFPTALFLLLILLPFSTAIKFALPPAKIPTESVYGMLAIVLVTANIGRGPDNASASTSHPVYLSKKDINCETCLAVTAHAKGEIGECFKNYLTYIVGLSVERKRRGQAKTEISRNMIRSTSTLILERMRLTM